MKVALAVGICLITAASAFAQPDGNVDTVVYKVKQNDSLGMIASEFYGDRSKASFIMVENKIMQVRPLRQYERLRIPVIREITTSPNDTFQSLAGALLGDPRRGGFLAEANGMSPDDNLAAGTPLLVPFTVTHTAAGVESIEALAANYYGDKKHAEVLRRYNDLEKNAIDKGETITIPSFNVRVHPTKIPPADSESKLRRDRRRDNTRAAALAIPLARHAWRIGDYATIRKALAEIDVAFIELAPAIDVGVLLGSAHVAFGDTENALAVFKRVVDRKPSHKLRKLDHSPKVLAVWTKADGQVE